MPISRSWPVVFALAVACTSEASDQLAPYQTNATPGGADAGGAPPVANGGVGADGGAMGNVGGATGPNAPGVPRDEGAICRSASSLDIFDAQGALDTARYQALAAAFWSKDAVGYRFGDDSTHYHPTPESYPTVYAPTDKVKDNGFNQPKSLYQVGGPWESDPGGYNTTGGQVLYVPDDPAQVGVDYIEFLAVSSNVVSEKPQLAWQQYGGGRPDPGIDGAAIKAAHGGAFAKPIAVARPVVTDTWQMDSLVAFQDGSIVSTGTHASGGTSTVMTKLPAGLVPTAIAITTNSELALVTVWDPAQVRGGVAVIALGGPENPGFWGDWKQVHPGLANHGLFAFMKVMGVVWIPEMVAPVAVSASADVRAPTLGAPERNTISLDDESTRQRFVPGGDLSMRYAHAGFAMVMSRSEKKVAFIDLEPTFKFFRESYFGTRASYDKTKAMGQASNQWPYGFDVAPEAMPTIVKVESFANCPTAIATSANVFRPNNFVDANDLDRRRDPPAGFAAHALIGTEEGTLHAYEVGGLFDDRAADPNAIKESSAIPVGRNPTSIASLDLVGALFGHPVDYAVVSRGDRRIELFKGDQVTGKLSAWKTLRDARLADPIHVVDVTYFGNTVPLFAVADYGGKKLVEYRYGKIELAFYGGQTFGMGANGNDEFECGGAYDTPGGVLFSSPANVP